MTSRKGCYDSKEIQERWYFSRSVSSADYGVLQGASSLSPKLSMILDYNDGEVSAGYQDLDHVQFPHLKAP